VKPVLPVALVLLKRKGFEGLHKKLLLKKKI
jgi:hypothetical protein